jgi:hypothetical protein
VGEQTHRQQPISQAASADKEITMTATHSLEPAVTLTYGRSTVRGTSRNRRWVVASLGVLAAVAVGGAVVSAGDGGTAPASCSAVGEPWPQQGPAVSWPTDHPTVSWPTAQPTVSWPTDQPAVSWPTDRPALGCLSPATSP